MKHLFLFDVDSVLVDALGYLRALQDTVAHFSRRMGVGEHPPTETEVRAGEAHGLTSEWDSAPTYIAILLIERLRREPALRLPPRWEDAMNVLAAHPMSLPHPDYSTIAARIGERLRQDGGATAPAARAVLDEIAQMLPQSQYNAVRALLDALLAHTYDFTRAFITQHFQHLVIGSEGIEQTYETAPAFTSSPYLRDYDVPLLNAQVREHLLQLSAAQKIGSVLYTARPSHPPADSETSSHGYSPEAELARALVGLDAWPLIGFGHVNWLGQRVGADAAILVKPSPVQALAAIGAAWSGQEAASLEAAWALHTEQRLIPPLSKMKAISVHVFEDSSSGLRAVCNAVAALNEAGVVMEYRPYGITPIDGAKAEAMARDGVTTYRSINEALNEALGYLM